MFSTIPGTWKPIKWLHQSEGDPWGFIHGLCFCLTENVTLPLIGPGLPSAWRWEEGVEMINSTESHEENNVESRQEVSFEMQDATVVPSPKKGP